MLLGNVSMMVSHTDTCDRRQYPPRSLMSLADSYSHVHFSQYSEMATSVSLLRAPPSWAMASIMTIQRQQDDKDTDSAAFTDSQEDPMPPVRAKCASGVPFLMSAVDETTVLSTRFQQIASPRSVTTQWELCQQIFFGSFSVEEPCAISSFFGAS